MSWRVPLCDVQVPESDVQAVLEVLREGWLTMGPRTQAFETAFGEFVGSPHVVAVSSGTAALHLAMRAAGVGPGDEVIVPSMTFVASCHAARYVGAQPVLCDIRGVEDLNLDPVDVEARITPRTKAVVAVHFCGYAADVSALRSLCDDRGLMLIEDAAQAVGAMTDDGRSVGTVGDVGCFSFFSKKQLCVGEGGMVASPDPDRAATARSLRSHAMTSVTWDRHRGHAESYDIVDVGYNFRIDEPRAALGLARLPRLGQDIRARRATVRRYRDALAGQAGIEIPWTDADVARSSHFAFPVLLPDRRGRDAVKAQLADEGVQTTWYPALHQLTEYAGRDDDLPRASEVAARHCALPLSSAMPDADVELVIDAVRRAAAAVA